MNAQNQKKRQLSDKQKLALSNGRKLGIEQRTCKQCGHVVQSKAKLRLSLCPSCYKHQVIMNQLKETKLKIKTFINKMFINKRSVCYFRYRNNWTYSKRSNYRDKCN